SRPERSDPWTLEPSDPFLLGFGELGDRLEAVRIVHGEIGEHVAIDGDAALLQSVHQPGVGEAGETRGGVDAHDPQAAELAPAHAAIAICVTPIQRAS